MVVQHQYKVLEYYLCMNVVNLNREVLSRIVDGRERSNGAGSHVVVRQSSRVASLFFPSGASQRFSNVTLIVSSICIQVLQRGGELSLKQRSSRKLSRSSARPLFAPTREECVRRESNLSSQSPSPSPSPPHLLLLTKVLSD